MSLRCMRLRLGIANNIKLETILLHFLYFWNPRNQSQFFFQHYQVSADAGQVTYLPVDADLPVFSGIQETQYPLQERAALRRN